jgi:hypothetical protein
VIWIHLKLIILLKQNCINYSKAIKSNMKKYFTKIINHSNSFGCLLLFILLMNFINIDAQISDTSKVKDFWLHKTKVLTVDTIKVKSSWYARSMPVSLYTGAGFINDKISQNIEVGRSIGVVDVGLVYGRINQRADSNKYVEARVTMDASQYGIFSNEISIGVGRVFNEKIPIMLEISYTVFAQVGKHFGVGIVTGYYDFSGVSNDVSKDFYGLFFRYGLQRTESGTLLSRRNHHAHHRR